MYLFQGFLHYRQGPGWSWKPSWERRKCSSIEEIGIWTLSVDFHVRWWPGQVSVEVNLSWKANRAGIYFFNSLTLFNFQGNLKQVYLESHQRLSSFWKENILCPIKNIYQEENREIQFGVMFDSSVFIPLYLKRFIMRQEREVNPLVPGHYRIVLKVWITLYLVT